MASDILAKKAAVERAYPSASWRAKVAKMNDGQIIAVYFRLKNQNKI